MTTNNPTPPTGIERVYEPMLKTREAAKMLGVSHHFLYKDRARQNPSVPFVKIGGSVRYRLSDLKAFIAKNRCGE